MNWIAALPFVFLLLAIAVFPLISVTCHHWEVNRNKLIVSFLCGGPIVLYLIWTSHGTDVLHATIEYLQFISLLLSLFVISGGILVKGDIPATPRTNVIILIIGGILASFIGTTGAAMVIIRPLLNINKERKNRVHTVVFLIFIVANCGGLLTPLGDPPLFLGMLRGVPFWWTLTLFPQWLFVNGTLLLAYLALERKRYCEETPAARLEDDTVYEKIAIKGKLNILLLGVIVLAVAKIPSLAHHPHIWYDSIPWRELVMLSAMGVSILISKENRTANSFSWHPIAEVAALFIGIFWTMIPALYLVRELAPTLNLTPLKFFLITGGLSSVLDNAPTYLTFFEIGRSLGGTPDVAGVQVAILVAISLGAVFFGATTYIGNGPNFMCVAIACSQGVPMPSFAGYTLKWAFRYLLPVLVIMAMIFVAGDSGIAQLGWLLWAISISNHLWGIYRFRNPKLGPPIETEK